MFKQVVSHKGFWKSVFTLGLAFVCVFILIKWAFEGFEIAFFTERDPWYLLGGSLVAGLAYGFIVSFGKFQSKIKNKNL
ncbi:hypothetical protein ATE92_0517 [Ulvibacter sp. MAR_2010_11]|uniref:hypothetical protein n=1 Tax=Ulvibacter sp. MAR_2010_11 TaxID=1250229 RepID=UPI000C2B5D80|nr:hypothetical protein [Ulvibacter sp. MAR_2010_11]PKA82388.1 hypothetical protein ATE92_0517 [Ulvibacter sp. MAR_2010_11]